MRPSQKRKLKKAARIGASGIGGLIGFVLKAIATVLLILITTGAIFACIFVVYIKTNLMESSKLDVELDDFRVNLSSTIYYLDNDTGTYRELVTLENEENRIWIDYKDIPIDFEHAVISIEDQRFYRHHGVDWYRTVGAFANMFIGMKNTFGGSTITQQLIKNVTNDKEGTVQRKLTEIFRALEFEKSYDKQDIIEWYLNVIFFGHKQYGIGAASEFYFGKDVSKLSLAEICSIVGITNNPSLYSPYISPENNKYRQELILGKMLEQGYITQAEYEEAKAEELHFQPWKTSRSTGVVVYSYYVDTVIDDVLDYFVESRGVDRKTAGQMLYYGGYNIYSCIDPDIQAKVDSIYRNLDEIPTVSGSSQQFQSAIVIEDPYTGDIKALAGGVGDTKTARGLNRIKSRRPPGSSIKPIAVYGPAMDLGLITPDTTFEDERDIKLSGTNWFPYNDDRQNHGVVTVRYGVVHSLNTIAAQVLDLLTPQVSYAFLQDKLNVTSLEPEDCDYAPLAIGQLTYGITVREMAAAYTIFPNSGVYTEGRTFSKIYDADWSLVCDNTPDSHAAISDTTAYWITDILQEAATSGTGREAKLSNMPTAGKTGTTSDKKDRWFAGYTPYYTCVVWTGYDTPATISATGNPAAQLWHKVMSLVHEELEPRIFPIPAKTTLAPVPGIGEAVKYYARGIAVAPDGGIEIIYEEEVGSRAAGRTVKVTAKQVEGYTLTSEPEATIVLSDKLSSNAAEFMYVSNTPPEPEEPEPDPNEGETPPEGEGGEGSETPPPVEGGDTPPEEPGESGGEEVPPENPGEETPPEGEAP